MANTTIVVGSFSIRPRYAYMVHIAQCTHLAYNGTNGNKNANGDNGSNGVIGNNGNVELRCFNHISQASLHIETNEANGPNASIGTIAANGANETPFEPMNHQCCQWRY